jgi:hypothetical protein
MKFSFDPEKFFADAVVSEKANRLVAEISRKNRERLFPEDWLLKRWRAQGALANQPVGDGKTKDKT